MVGEIDGLMHLGALSVLVTAGYVGYDRIRRDSNDFYAELSKLRTRVRERFLELDVMTNDVLQLNPIVDFFAARLLSHVAGIRTNETRGKRFGHWLKCSIWHAPGLPLFRTKADRWIIVGLCFIVLIAFLHLISATVWDVWLGEVYKSAEGRKNIFWLFTCTILAVFVALACSHRVQAIEEQYEEFNRQVDARKTEAKTFLDTHT